MNTRRFFSAMQDAQRWMSAAVLLAGSSFVSSAFAAIPPSFSGAFSQMHNASPMGNTTYTLVFLLTGVGLPIQLTKLPSGLNGAVTEDLTVSFGSTGTSNGSGGPVVLSKLAIASGVVRTLHGDLNGAAVSFDSITSGLATLNANPTKTASQFASYRPNTATAKFPASYEGADSPSHGVVSLRPRSGSDSYNLLATVPENAPLVTGSIGVAMLGGFFWRRRRAPLEMDVGNLAFVPC